MRLFRNHNAMIAACYGGHACALAAAGKLGEAAFYGLVGLLHAVAAQHDQAGPTPPPGGRDGE